MTLERDRLEELTASVEADPATEITVDLEAGSVGWGGRTATAELAESARTALISGEWDFLSQLLANSEAIRETAATIPYLRGFGGA